MRSRSLEVDWEADQDSDHPKLLCSRVETHDFNWIHYKVPKGIVPGGKKRAFIQVRHRMEPVSAVVSHNWDGKG